MKTIKFAAEMIEKIIEGKKTMTCRLAKKENTCYPKYRVGDELDVEGWAVRIRITDFKLTHIDFCEEFFVEEGFDRADDFRKLWDKCCPETLWASNPLVYRYTFERID